MSVTPEETTTSYGIYGRPAWQVAASSVEDGRSRFLEIDWDGGRIGFEIDSYPLLGGLKVAVPAGYGRTLGLAPICSLAQSDSSWVPGMLQQMSEGRVDVVFIPRLWQEDANVMMSAMPRNSGWLSEVHDGEVVGRQSLGDNLDETLGALSKNERKSVRRRFRRLDDFEELEMRDQFDPAEIVDTFALFKDVHAAEWRSRGRQGHYRDWPDSTAFVEVLLKEAARDGEAVITGIWNRDVPVALQLGFICDGLASAVQLAHSSDHPQYDAISPTILAYFRLVDIATSRGVKTMELGLGSYDYKHRLGAVDVPLSNLFFIREGALSRARTSVARGLHRMLHLGYYRGWFNRGSEKLGIAPGPLLRSWRRLPQ